jgi:hypothetical protein
MPASVTWKGAKTLTMQEGFASAIMLFGIGAGTWALLLAPTTLNL